MFFAKSGTNYLPLQHHFPQAGSRRPFSFCGPTAKIGPTRLIFEVSSSRTIKHTHTHIHLAALF